MKNAKTILFGILVAAIALSALVAPAAAGFVHPRGMMITTYPQDIVVFWGRPANYDKTLAVWMKPPWYFVDDVMGFDSVTLTITLTTSCYQCKVYSGGKPLQILGADTSGRLVIQWSNVMMSEEDNGALLLAPITFTVTGSTARGYYMLFLSAEAHANGLTFKGWDQVPVAVTP